jgi:hypothetical protein
MRRRRRRGTCVSHAELLAGDIYRIVSGRLVDGPHAGSIVHWMSHAGTGKLVATALDGGAPVFDCPQVPEATVAAALPRSVDVVEGALAFERMGRDGWLPTARCWVTMDRCSARGELTEQHLTAIFGDAAGHVWERAGAGVVWGARERARPHRRRGEDLALRPARAGDLLILHSRVGPAQGRSVLLQHHLHRCSDGAPIARADVTALLIDHEVPQDGTFAGSSTEGADMITVLPRAARDRRCPTRAPTATRSGCAATTSPVPPAGTGYPKACAATPPACRCRLHVRPNSCAGDALDVAGHVASHGPSGGCTTTRATPGCWAPVRRTGAQALAALEAP